MNIYNSFKKAKPSDKPVTSPEYLVQRKYDGERVKYVDKGSTGYMINRLGTRKDKQFPEFSGLAKAWPGRNIVEGELVIYQKPGIESFKLLAERTHLKHPADIAAKARTNPATLMIFDTLQNKGRNVTGKPLVTRNKLLPPLKVSHTEIIKNYPAVDYKRLMNKPYVEGVIFKQKNAPYTPGKDDTWIKYKRHKDADLAITGYEPGEGKRTGTVGALYLGVWGGNALKPIGRVGAFKNFSTGDLRQLKHRLDNYSTGHEGTRINTKPKLFASIEYLKKGTRGNLREPKVVKIRTDIRLQDTHASKGGMRK